MANLHEMTATELGRILAEKKASSVEITEAFLKRIEAVEEKVHSYVTVTSELALEMAGEADRRLAREREAR